MKKKNDKIFSLSMRIKFSFKSHGLSYESTKKNEKRLDFSMVFTGELNNSDTSTIPIPTSSIEESSISEQIGEDQILWPRPKKD